MILFSDGSFDPKSKLGIAGFYILEDQQTEISVPTVDKIASSIRMEIHKDTNCTRVELMAVISGMEFFLKTFTNQSLTIYTDCQTAAQLPSRRTKLESNNFQSKRTGKPLNNADLYKDFYTLFDDCNPKIHWIKGHKAGSEKNTIDNLFSILDKRVRRELRNILVNNVSL